MTKDSLCAIITNDKNHFKLRDNEMEKEVKVSVIVPVYNSEAFIRQTAEYILGQSLKDIEIIFVDDGSTDKTREILEEISKTDDRVKVLHQQNSFAGAARNYGFRESSGKYLVFWDADDIFLPEALEKMYDKIVEDDADICICPADYYDNETSKILKNNVYIKYDMIPEKTPFFKEDVEDVLFNFSTNVPWNKMFKRELITDNNLEFQQIQRANDNYFVMTAFFYANTFTYIKESVIQYRINLSTSLIGGNSKTPLCVYEAYKKTYDRIKDEAGFDKVRQSFLNKAMRACFYFLSVQTKFESYEVLYNKYKNEVFKEWNYPEDKEFYYNEKDYNRYQRMKESTAIEFMVCEYQGAINEVRKLKNSRYQLRLKNDRLKDKNDRLREKNEKLKIAKENLKAQVSRLKARIAEIENSTSFKIGKAITYLPGLIKKAIKGKK